MPDQPRTPPSAPAPAPAQTSAELTSTFRRTDSGEFEPAVAPGATYGRFVVERLLGTGGMGWVLAARDPTLDRRVALKLLRPGLWAGTEGRVRQERLRNEARAMAQLSHPHVVTLYEVGGDEAHPFLVMELVEGTTLKEHLRAHRPALRELLRLFLAAGRGLEAAHAVGLVHRDFKPDNVLVDANGRVRVTDFGLAELDAAKSVARAQAQAALPELAGTPAYMSPEQWQGTTADARSDQFSFCVALWEAVEGHRPFPGDRWDELQRAVLADQRLPWSGRAPRWLGEALERGLQRDPAQRWPDLGALLAVLEKRLTARQLSRRLLAALVTTALAGGLWFGLAGGRLVRCEGASARLAELTGPAKQEALRLQFLAIDPARGQRRFVASVDVLGELARSWKADQAAACGTLSRLVPASSETGRTLDCLDRRLSTLEAGLDRLLRAGTRHRLDDAVRELAGLGLSASCVAVTSRPPDASPSGEPVRRDLGRSGGLARPDADALAALEQQARLALSLDDAPRAAASLERLARQAAQSDEPQLEAWAWTRLVRLNAGKLAQPELAARLLPVAEASVHRAGDPWELQVDLLSASARLDAERREHARAVDAASQAVALLRPHLDQGTSVRVRLAEALQLLGLVQSYAGNLEGAQSAYHDSLQLLTHALGEDHAGLAPLQLDLAQLHRRAGRPAEALTAAQEAVRIGRARGEDSSAFVSALLMEATVRGERGETAGALRALEEAQSVAARVLDPDDPKHVELLVQRGALQWEDGSPAVAEAAFSEAVKRCDRSGRRGVNCAVARLDLGQHLEHQEPRSPGGPGPQWAREGPSRLAEALANYESSAREMEALGSAGARLLVFPLLGQGRSLVKLGRSAEAREPLERALAIAETDEAQASARFWLGRALLETGSDVARGRQLVSAGRAAAQALEPDERAEVLSWRAGASKKPRR